MPLYTVTQRPKRTLRSSSGLSPVSIIVEAADKKEALAKALAFKPEMKLLTTENLREFNKIQVRELELPCVIA